MCRWYLKTCRKTRPCCWHHPCHVFMSPLISCLHSMVLRAPCSKPKDLGLASGPMPVSKGDRPRRWVVFSIPSQPRLSGLGLFPPPLLPTPLGPTLSGERPMAFSVPRECCAGAVGNRPTALAVGVTGSALAVWSSDKACWCPTCWP